MTRPDPIRPPEKIMAVAGIYIALSSELEGWIEAFDPRVQVALIESATAIALSTDTSDLGLLVPAMKPVDEPSRSRAT